MSLSVNFDTPTNTQSNVDTARGSVETQVDA